MQRKKKIESISLHIDQVISYAYERDSERASASVWLAHCFVFVTFVCLFRWACACACVRVYRNEERPLTILGYLDYWFSSICIFFFAASFHSCTFFMFGFCFRLYIWCFSTLLSVSSSCNTQAEFEFCCTILSAGAHTHTFLRHQNARIPMNVWIKLYYSIRIKLSSNLYGALW